MALRQSQGSRAVPDCPQYISSLPEQTVKPSRDQMDPEEPHSSNTESQSSTPVPSSHCLNDGSVSGKDFVHGEIPIHHDNLDKDSLSEYDNVGSEEEEEEQDYEEDEELHTDADGLTYYVHCCPEDESYLEGMDCHECAESSDRPSTSKKTGAGGKPEDAWEFSEGFYEVLQQDKTEGGQDGIICKGQCDVQEDCKNPHQVSTCSKGTTRGEKDLSKEYGPDERISKKCNSDIQRSFNCQREGIKNNIAEVKVDYSENCELTDKKTKPIIRGHQICKEDRGSRNGIFNTKTKPDNPVNKEHFKRRHSHRDHGRDKKEDGCLHVVSDSFEDNIGKGQGSPHNYIAKTRQDRERSLVTGEDMDQIRTEVRTKIKVLPQSTGVDRGVSETSYDKRRIPESSQASVLRPHREEYTSSTPTTPMQLCDPQLQNDLARCCEEDSMRSNQAQVTHSSPQHCTVNPQSETNTAASNHNLPQQGKRNHSFPSFVDVPGPCEPEDLIDGIIFAANYLGSTQLLSDRNPSKGVRMSQAQEAVDKVKCVDKESQSPVEVDLFISTKAIKVLNADTQETMIDNALRTISYIADIGSVVVLMARRRVSQSAALDCNETGMNSAEDRKQYRMICYVFESEDAQLIAQSIGQVFSMAYQEFLRANGINPKDLSQKDYSDILNSQEMYNDDLIHFSNSENCKELQLEKQKGEILGVVIVESGWGSILPTVILTCMLNSGPAARSGKLNVGDQIMAVNDTSLVGLPLATCQGIIKGLKNQLQVKLSVVSCPPVTTVLIKRPDLQYPLGFSVQNGIICSLMRGGIAERGGVRVGHRIIEINGQSVVAMAHEKIVHALSVSVGEIHMKTMPAVMFRLLTGQETPMYI
ncbi:amyloid beta A4 precursor protein-binding family A member 2 isoform X1 [Silurus asotus]|uniref:Amyloid-beta A4 precursor protein-binding family A member 3 n=1 Tax=Silurus asotus TaxID=30991 RepID=A0AAD5B255_SILAS|nr:amyloid beta A4 precursor protein-binding family A member 2 isoform X1 [Silurus asotus]